MKFQPGLAKYLRETSLEQIHKDLLLPMPAKSRIKINWEKVGKKQLREWARRIVRVDLDNALTSAVNEIAAKRRRRTKSARPKRPGSRPPRRRTR